VQLQQGIAEQQIHELNSKMSFYENELMQSEGKLESLAKPTTSTKKCGQYTDEIRKLFTFVLVNMCRCVICPML